MRKGTYTEKVSVNVNSSVLSEIDLLVDSGYYSNRSDFINQAVRECLQRQHGTVERLIEENRQRHNDGNDWFVGVCGYTAKDIEDMFENGEQVRLYGYGVLVLDTQCDEQKLFQVVTDIHVHGKVLCSPRVKAHYGIK